MKSKKLFIFAGITLLFLLQSFAVAGPVVTTTNHVVNSRTSVSSHIEAINPLVTKDYVIFADSPDEYTTLTSLFNVKYEFPLLRAVVVDLSDTQAKVFGNIFASVIPLSAYENIPIPTVNQVVDNGLSLSSTEDADFMHVSEMWNLGYTGQGIAIGQIDNGVDTTHPALTSKVVEQQIFHGTTGVWTPFHGTNVAGTMVGDARDDSAATGDNLKAIGNAYNASLYSAGLYASEDGKTVIGGIYMLQAYEWLLSLNGTVKVINLSLGGGYSSAFQQINEQLEAANIMVVASAGNEGPASNTVGCPSCYTNAISVAAEDRSGATTYFSSRGPSAVPGLKPDVIAPGKDVLTTSYDNPTHGYERVDGTSFSSPLTAAGLAVLMSALNTEGYTWNPGTIKAALIRGAYWDTPSFTGNYEIGMGEVDIKDSWDYLLANNPSAGFAKAIALTPLSNNIFEKDLFSGITTKQRGFTLITSNPADVSVSIGGDIASFMTYDASQLSSSKYSQELPLIIDTTGLADGTYSGTVSVSLNGETLTASLTYNIVGPATGVVAFDVRHTDWDENGADTLIGSNTGAMVSKMKSNGYWVESVNEELTSSVLANYDLVWIPDPMDLSITVNGDDIPFTGSYFTDAEVTALVNYVDNGGSILMDFNGLFVDDTTQVTVGTNASAVNKLLSHFGITSNDVAADGDINTKFIPIANTTTITGGATKVVHAGNYLSIDTTVATQNGAILYPITGTDSQTTIAAYDKLDGGRVIVASTNFWLDNQGSTSGYTAGDPEVAQGAFNWLTTEDQITLLESEITTSGISAKVHVSPNVAPTVSRLASLGLNATSISTTDLGGGDYSFTYDLTEDGIHKLQAVTSTNDYIAFSTLLDLNGPTITPAIANNSVVDETAEIFQFSFEIVDTTYQVSYADVVLKLDNVVKDEKALNRRFSGTTMLVSIFSFQLDMTVEQHFLEISASDNFNHTTVYLFAFILGDPSTVTSTTTTSSVVTTPTDTKSAPINLFAMLSGIVVITAFAYRKKSKIFKN